MKVMTEKEAEAFLAKEDFNIVKGVFVKNKSEVGSAVKKIGFPVVMKVSGKKIVHKNVVDGIRVEINNYDEAVQMFSELKKIKGCEEVLIQKEVEGKEFLLGIKKTPEFGHVVVFGAGGVDVEKIKDVSFLVCPVARDEIKKMIKEVWFAKGVYSEKIVDYLIKLNDLVAKYPEIKELDINPLFVFGKNVVVADARIVFD